MHLRWRFDHTVIPQYTRQLVKEKACQQKLSLVSSSINGSKMCTLANISINEMCHVSHTIKESYRSYCTPSCVTLCKFVKPTDILHQSQEEDATNQELIKNPVLVEEVEENKPKEIDDYNHKEDINETDIHDDKIEINQSVSEDEKSDNDNDQDDDDDDDDDDGDGDDGDDIMDESDNQVNSFFDFDETKVQDMSDRKRYKLNNDADKNYRNYENNGTVNSNAYTDWSASYTYRKQMREAERMLRFVELLSPANIHKYVNTSEVTTPDGVRWLDIYAKPTLWHKVKSARIVEGDFTLAVIKTLIANTPVEHMYSRLINASSLPTVMFDENCVCLLLRTPHVKFEWKQRFDFYDDNNNNSSTNSNNSDSTQGCNHYQGSNNRSNFYDSQSNASKDEGMYNTYTNCRDCNDWRQSREIEEKASMLERLRAYDISNNTTTNSTSSSASSSPPASSSSSWLSSSKLHNVNAYKEFVRENSVQEKKLDKECSNNNNNNNINNKNKNKNGNNKYNKRNLNDRKRTREQQRARRRMWNKVKTILFGKTYLEKQKAMNAALKAPTTHDLTDRLNIFIIREPHPVMTARTMTNDAEKTSSTNVNEHEQSEKCVNNNKNSANVKSETERVINTSFSANNSKKKNGSNSNSNVGTIYGNNNNNNNNCKNSNDNDREKIKTTENEMRWRIITIHREPNIFIQHIHLHWHLFVVDTETDDRLFVRDKNHSRMNKVKSTSRLPSKCKLGNLKEQHKVSTNFITASNNNNGNSSSSRDNTDTESKTNSANNLSYYGHNQRHDLTPHRPHASFANMTKSKLEEEEEVRSFDWKSAEWHQAAHIEHWLPFHHTAGSWDSVLRLIIHGTLRGLHQAVRRSTLALDILERAIFKDDDVVLSLNRTTPIESNGASTLKERIQFMSQLHVLSRQAKIYVNIIREMQDAHNKLKRSLNSPFDRMDRREVLYGESTRALGKLLNEQSQSLLLLQFNIAMNQMERHLRTLTLFSTFFIPLDFIASCFGTNFPAVEQMEESTNSGFFIATCMLLVAAFVTSRWLKLRER